MNLTMKSCSKCGEIKTVADFSKDASKRDMLHSSCKVCDRIAKAAYNAANSEKNKACTYKWRAENPERHLANSAKWRAANSEKVRAATEKWQAANFEKYKEGKRIIEQNRRASKLASGGKLSKGLAERLFKLQRGKCACGCKQPLGDRYHLDHIMPLVLGGSNTDDNIQLLRQLCNNQKYAKHPVDFMQQRGFLL